MRALIADLELALPQIWGRRVYSVFFGGGTPSLFSARAIEELLAAFRARLNLAADAEITLEANPGTFESAKFRDYRACGVNRLSIGIQSFNSAQLQALGRIHDGEEARRAIGIAQAHFDNINLDLMYALPQQTLQRGGAGHRRSAQLRHHSSVGLSPHAGTQYPVLPPSAAVAGPRTRRRHAGPHRGAPRRRRLSQLRDLGVRAHRAGVPAQSQLLAFRRLPGHRRRRAFQAFVPRPHCAPDALQAAARIHAEDRSRIAGTGSSMRLQPGTWASNS